MTRIVLAFVAGALFAVAVLYAVAEWAYRRSVRAW